MKFRVERDALADALAWVARALPSRPVVPVLSGLRLAAGDGLTLSCFDYEVSATAHIDADVAEPGTALVPGRLLAEITRNLPALAAEFDADGDAVNLTCGSAQFTLVPLPAEEYPELPQPPPLAGTVDGGVLAAAIGQVVPAASRDDTLPMLTGVCLDIDGATMTLAATDRYRMAVREVSWHPVRPDLRAVALVPVRTLADAARAMTPGVPVSIGFEAGAGEAGAAESGHGVSAGHSGASSGTARAGTAAREPRPAEGMISFGIGGRRLTARLIAGEFIRYRSRFPSEFGCRADVPAVPFTEAVRRVSLVADRTSPVRLSFGSGQVVVEAQTEGRARAVETVAADFRGDESVISFNPHYLLDGLAAAAVPGPARETGAEPSSGTREPGDDEAAAGDGAPADPGAPGADGEPAGDPADGDTAAAAGSGLLRLEFTSPAKPALITWAEAGSGGDAGSDESAAPAVPPFRYLVVPLRAAVRS